MLVSWNKNAVTLICDTMKFNILTLVVSFILAFFVSSSCNHRGNNITTEQLREAQKDSVVNASFKGLSLGDSKDNIMKFLTEMENSGDIEKISTGNYSKSVEDCLNAIDAVIVPEMTYFRTKLVMKMDDNYKQVEVLCYLGFLQDSLSTVVLLPSFLRSDLERDKVIGTYTQKYGGLYYIEDKPKREPYGREYISGEGDHYNQIYETTAITVNNLVWRFKNAEIYLGDKTEFESIYTYDEDAFRREWTKLHLQYGNNQFDLCERIKSRLYGSKRNEQNSYPFIAYKYVPTNQREIERVHAEQVARMKDYNGKKAMEDSLENARSKELYSKQDI